MIRIDHLYGPNPDGPGILDQVDWKLLEEILIKAHKKEKLSFVGKGFDKKPISVNEPLPRVVIVEGIRLLQPKLLPYFDRVVELDPILVGKDGKEPLRKFLVYKCYGYKPKSAVHEKQE